MAMTVRDLRNLLADEDDDTVVILSSDAEGNSHSPAAGYGTELWYQPETTWSGEIDTEPYSSDDVKAFVLWPVYR